jgi:hypothetical protein
MKYIGSMRIYFNKHGSKDFPWCVAAEGWELALGSVVVEEAILRSSYEPKVTPDDEDGKPSAWLSVTGTLAVTGGTARITRIAP